jgi:hypothetical protein
VSPPELTPNEHYRIFAESYILRCIGAFDPEAQKRLLDAYVGAPYATADEALTDFEAAESIAAAQVEWITKTWSERKSADPKASPRRFAEEIANLVFSDFEF